MKIGIICYPTHGGSGVIASELAIGLAERGHEVHIISYATPFRLTSFYHNVFIHEVQISSYPLFKFPPYALGLATKLAEVAEEYDLDILHAHYAVPHTSSAYLAKHILRSEKLKIITTLHGTDITLVGQDQTFYRVIKFNIEESDGVTAVSNYLCERTMKDFNIEREIRVIHNFIDTNRCKEKEDTCTKSYFAPHGESVLIHASNFRPVKRVSDIIHLLARLKARIPVKLILVGEGPDRPSVQRLVKDLNLVNDVYFMGEQDYIEKLLKCADLFVLPSQQESFGLVALEAQACGVPVIGTTIGGIPEAVEHGSTGYLVSVGDIDSMAKYSLDLLTDVSTYKKFQKQAIKRTRDLFNKDMIITQYENYYKEILNQ